MALDGTLMFGTGIDNSGFSSGVSNLQAQANVALGNISADMIGQLSSAAAQIPQQVIAVGLGFEASMSSAKTVGNSAFSNCVNLKSVNMPLAETVEANAFQNCVSLIDLKYSEDCIFDTSAFTNCFSLYPKP